MINTPPLGLYIHIPWCVKKCPYCDFNSHEHHSKQLPEKEYLNALINDLDSELKLVDEQREIHSVFIGGGTPSLLSGDFYIQLFAALNQRLNFSVNAEITIEANPGAVDEANFKGFIDAGINRISLGAQSFSDAALNRLGRIHDNRSIYHAFETARKCGFDNINVDLMHGLPEQSLAEGLDDLKAAFELSPEHISWYQLTIEPNTPFHSKPPKLPQDDVLWKIQDKGIELLAQAGYQQYEISAFSKPEFQCQHNLNYWQFGDYIGIGCGAHGKITDAKNNSIFRTVKVKHPKGYLDKEREHLDHLITVKDSELPFEYMMNRLRLYSSFTLDDYQQATGLEVESVLPTLELAKKKQFMEQRNGSWQVSQHGHRYLNDLLEMFL